MRGVLYTKINVCVFKFLTNNLYLIALFSDKGCSCPICQAEYEVSYYKIGLFIHLKIGSHFFLILLLLNSLTPSFTLPPCIACFMT